MSFKKCEKCGEMVGEAKAFCPGCGYSFVDEEEREEDSEFDVSGGTMNISESAYDVLLSDMGLNISETTEAPDQPDTPADLIPRRQTNDGTQKNAASGKKFLIVLVLAFIVLLIAAVVFIVF